MRRKKLVVALVAVLSLGTMMLFSGCGGSGGGSGDVSASGVSLSAGTPLPSPDHQAGNAAAECAQYGDFLYAYKVDPFGNGTSTATFEDGHVNYITIDNSDGTYFDWSATPNPIGAVIVKGGAGGANVFFYDPQAFTDTELYAPNNPSGKPAEVSHATFCWNPEDVEKCFEYETAWGAGSRYTTRGNWATYTQYGGVEKTLTLYAGQTIEAGTVTFSAFADGEVTITITLNAGFKFDDRDPAIENIHIQGYGSAPSGNPAPGQFGNKYTATTSPFEVTVPAANFYGVHVVVGVPVDCPEEE